MDLIIKYGAINILKKLYIIIKFKYFKLFYIFLKIHLLD
jgi:hypothetical protein